MIDRLKALAATLRPWQASLVIVVFFVTLFGALALAAAFKWWNEKEQRK